MEIPPLDTKHFIPFPKRQLVNRPRLTHMLDSALESGHQVVLMVAPAGYGKSSLVASWAKKSPIPVAWVSLDEHDGDPEVFVSYLVSGLESIGIPIDPRFKETLKHRQNVPLRKLLRVITSEILRYGQEFVLVLDDFHLIFGNEMLTGLCDFVADIPEFMHMVFISRAIPEIPCAKLSVRDRLLRIDEQHLRFTREEISQFFRQNFDRTLSAEEVALIEKRTEGWVTGLQLIGLASKNRHDVHSFLESISSPQQVIHQYLVEEVLSTLSPEVQAFLLHTAQLERFSLPLLKHLMGREMDTERLLQEVQENRLFIIPLAESGEWYRYHHLFAELLRSIAARENPEQVRVDYLQAAAWFRRHAYWADAIHYGLLAQDYTQVEKDIETNMHQYWQLDKASRILSWIKALPKEILHKNPNLRLLLSWVQFHHGDIMQGFQSLQEIRECLEHHDCTRGLSREKVQQIEAIIATQEAAYHCRFGNAQISLQKANYALETISPDARMWMGISQNAKGMAYRTLGRCQQALQEFTRAAQTHRENKNIYGLVTAWSFLTKQHYDMGQLNQAYGVCKQAIDYIQQYDQQFIPLGIIYITLAKIYLDWGDYEQAEKTLYTCIDIFIEEEDLEYSLESYYQLARLQLVRQGLDKAQDTIMQAAAMIGEKNPPMLLAVRLRAYQARLLALGGKVERAAVLMNLMDLTEDDQARFEMAKKEFAVGRVTAYVMANNVMSYSLDFEKQTQAMLLTMQGFPREALVLLNELEGDRRHNKCSQHHLNAMLLQALALDAGGEKEASREMLNRAVDWSQPNGQIFSYVEHGESIRAMLAQLSEEEKAQAAPGSMARVNRVIYLNKLLGAFQFQESLPDKNHNRAVAADALLSLTNRETEVLEMLAKGYTYYEIGERLTVTENTVRTHIRGIYSKLDVNNRVLAISRAFELGIIKEM